MELSTEDSLRINVLLHQDLHAIRIDESKMIVYGLSTRGEAQVPLNPNCRDEKYIKHVKEVISSHVLGSPGGYPVFLRRWTRMGQARDDSLERLLLLGEEEAVVAVVHASGLTDELARHAWWAMPTSANARCMLERGGIVDSEIGVELAAFLVDYLPFEEEPKDIIESVRLVLQPGLLSAEERQSLWSKGQRKNAYLVGFLKTVPDELPVQTSAHPHYQKYQQKLSALAEAGNPHAIQILRLLSVAGQAYLQTILKVMKKPANQDVVVALLEALQAYSYLGNDKDENILASEALRAEIPEIEEHLQALLALSQVGVHLVDPIFARTDAIGTVMRKKLEPVFNPIQEQIEILLGKGT